MPCLWASWKHLTGYRRKQGARLWSDRASLIGRRLIRSLTSQIPIKTGQSWRLAITVKLNYHFQKHSLNTGGVGVQAQGRDSCLHALFMNFPVVVSCGWQLRETGCCRRWSLSMMEQSSNIHTPTRATIQSWMGRKNPFLTLHVSFLYEGKVSHQVQFYWGAISPHPLPGSCRCACGRN